MNLKRFFYPFIVFSMLLFSNVWSQETTEEYNFVNIKEGISNVAVSTISQDHYGFIWIGTNGAGLYKFDGIDYTSYKYKVKDSTSLSNSLVHCSYLDKKNRLWIGTEDGLNLYDRDQDKFKRISFDRTYNSNIAVNRLSGDSNGNIYIGTFEKGLFKLDFGSESAKYIPLAVNDGNVGIVNINGIKVDINDQVYVGSNLGLQEYDANTRTLKTSFFNTDTGMYSVNEPIQSILLDNKNNIWVGSLTKGLFRVQKGDNETGKAAKIDRFKISDKRILSMIQIPNGTLMIGTENDGLFNIDQEGKVLKNYLSDKTDKNSIRSNSIWSLFLDNNQRIWMGYYNSGLGVYDKLYDKFKHIESLPNNPNSLQLGSVTGFAQDDKGDIWIGMDGGGIDIYNPSSHKFIHVNKNLTSKYSGLTSADIQTVFIDSKKNVWAGTWNNGLFLLKKDSNKFINYNTNNSPEAFDSNSILSIDEDSNGTIWIGTFYNGVLSYNPSSGKFTHHDSLPFLENELYNSAVRKILVDSNDVVWVGTTEGLFSIKKNADDFTVKSMFEDMSNTAQSKTNANHILSLYEGADGFIWIGTRGSGLCRYNKKDGEFSWYNDLYDLNLETISSIIQSLDGNLWLSGNSGVSKLDLKTNRITKYTSNDGLLSNDFNFNAVLRDREGVLYFGNYLGVDYFNPSDIKINLSLPSLYLTGLKVFNKEVIPDKNNSLLKKGVAETDDIVFRPSQSVFTIEYTGINYTRPEKNQYAYYLEGLEESWNYVGNIRSATYTNLDAGDYIFKLKSANNDGIWNESPLNLKITILPPWWKTKWAILAYIGLFFLCVYLLNLITKKRVKEKELIRAERNRRVQEGKLHEKKLQFFTNISHEFRTPLTLMINPLKDIINDESLNLPEKIKNKHAIIYKNTDRLYRLINELMDFRKLELNKARIKVKQLNIVDLAKDVTSYFKEEAINRNIHLAVDADVPDLSVWADERMLEKIIFNILSNAMKVTPDDGAINIDLISTDELVNLPLVSENKPSKAIEIIITDTGPGLEKEQVKRIFERFYQVENLNKTYYGGTGIGLEVVQSFVQLHKGKVKVKSKVGEGTTFRIFLPAGKKHFKENQIISHKTEVQAQKEGFVSTSILSNIREEEVEDKVSKTNTLLIVEDNVELRNYLKDELKNQYKVLVANNGKEGLVVAKESLPDIIITDVMMPEMDGFDFCKHIKSDIRTSHIPLLMLTAKIRIEDRIEGIGFGADAYMAKPFDLRLLKLRLTQLVTSRQLIFDKYFAAISGSEENANATSIDKDFIQKVLTYINDNMSDSDLSVELLASQLHLSRSQLYRKIKTLTGQTVNEFLRKIRLQKAKQILETENVNISEVCYKVGFSSPSYFTKCFKAHFGVLPTDVESKSL